MPTRIQRLLTWHKRRRRNHFLWALRLPPRNWSEPIPFLWTPKFDFRQSFGCGTPFGTIHHADARFAIRDKLSGGNTWHCERCYFYDHPHPFLAWLKFWWRRATWLAEEAQIRVFHKPRKTRR